jgi:hypothetical protein
MKNEFRFPKGYTPPARTEYDDLGEFDMPGGHNERIDTEVSPTEVTKPKTQKRPTVTYLPVKRHGTTTLVEVPEKK